MFKFRLLRKFEDILDFYAKVRLFFRHGYSFLSGFTG